MHRSEKYQKVAKGATILDLSLAIHGYCSGSLEADPRRIEEYYEVLQEVVEEWKVVLVPSCAVFDNACLQVVLAALQEYDYMNDDFKPKNWDKAS